MRWVQCKTPCCLQRECGIIVASCAHQVLQLPILRPKSVKKLLGDGGLGPSRTVPILGSGQTTTTEDTLEQFLQHAGTLFGKDPSKLEKVGTLHINRSKAAAINACCTAVLTSLPPPAGEPTTDITEQDGKRINKRTGMYTGTQLHLFRYHRD